MTLTVEQIEAFKSYPDLTLQEALTSGTRGRKFIEALCDAAVRSRPRLSMEMLASLEETWEAMEAVGEDPNDAAALRALLDWHYNFSTPATP